MDKLVIGCGYLGRRVARAWLAQGSNVWAMTRSPARGEEFAREGFRPLVADICDAATLRVLPAVQTILFAVGYDRTSGRSQQSVYVDGLRNVLERLPTPPQRLIYISSSSVYGQSNGEWVDETSECIPSQPGGQCCLQAEELVKAALPDQASILRLSGIYGPGRLLSRLESLRAREPIAGRPDAWLNLIHVDDAAAAVLASEHRGSGGETTLVTDSLPIRREEYYRLLAQLSGTPAPVFNPESPAARGSGGLNKRCLNRRMREILQVQLTYPTINEGLPHSLTSSEGWNSERTSPVG
jgi:nucleoside-diphosphate-sugar epimerase